MNNIKSLENIKLIISGSDKLEKKDLVANWSNTRIYLKTSWKGRFWQIITFIGFKGKNSVQITLDKTTKVFNEFTHLKAQIFCDKVNDLKQTIDFWKIEHIDNMLESLHKFETAIQTIKLLFSNVNEKNLDNLSSILGQKEFVDTIKRSLQSQPIKKAQQKIGNFLKLEKRATELNIKREQMLYFVRELSWNYPKTNQSLLEKRNALQSKPHYVLNSPYNYNNLEESLSYTELRCSEEYLYAPIIAFARDMAKSDKDCDSIKQFCKDLLNEATNVDLLIDLVQHFRGKKELVDGLPEKVQSALKNDEFVNNCHYHETRVQFHCRKEFRKVVQANPFIFTDSPFLVSYEPEDRQQAFHVKTTLLFIRQENGVEKVETRETENICS